MSDLLKKQQEVFKEQVDELYFIQRKIEERVREFTAGQVELLEKSEKHLNTMKHEMSARLQNEAFAFERIRSRMEEDRAWNSSRTYGLYLLCISVFVMTIMNIWAIYNDLTKRPGDLYESYKYTVEGKEVVIDSKSIRKVEINGKEHTFAVVKVLP